MDAAIVTEGLSRSFGAVRALDGVSLTVAPGEIYGFLGPNGAGKTTLVRILCTLSLPSSGRAVVAGYDVATHPDEVRVRIGAALQSTALDPKQSGRELLALQCRLYGLPPVVARRRIAELAELVELGPALDRWVGTYSGGMQRRLDLALALVHGPAVLFLDEPTPGLDPASRTHVWSEIRRLNSSEGTTVFLTTHYLEEADTLAHRVGIIHHGRLVAEDRPEALKRSIGSDVLVAEVAGDSEAAVAAVRDMDGVDAVEVFEEELTIRTRDGGEALSPVAVALHTAGVAVRSLTLRTPTLDDVFLSLTGGRMSTEGEP